ncbi:imm11 family protein [Archangium sp.]|uniref:imm11 family protein n=1 Tax=Archangium sp. TaxID=1872627 RepID=UPI002D6D2403|nr:DUF1629 domain-containing protein [Archangium sp.]HYO55195.1 DUF1629 domain-containing protein [Archangium sp.]
MKYFELENDMGILDRWELGDPIDGSGQEIWHGHFSKGLPLSIQLPVRIGMYARGRALDFSTTALGVTVIHDKVKTLFERIGIQDQMQLFPITIEEQSDLYYILNLLRTIRCIDDERCEEVGYRTAEEGYEDGIGEYHKVVGMRIDSSKVGDAEIFRPWGWPVSIIISERVKKAMEVAGVTGTRFTEV